MKLEEMIKKLEDTTVDSVVCEQGELTTWLKELAEAKRLLRLAIVDIDTAMTGDGCDVCKCDFAHCTTRDCKWRYAAEAKKLLEERDDNSVKELQV